MTSKQEAKVSMYDAVINHCESNPAIVAAIPAFQAAVTAFTTKYSSIISAAQLELTQITGIAVDKVAARKTLAQQAANIAGAVFAYAASIGNNELKEQARHPVSKFTNMKDELVVPTCQGIHDLANANIAALAPYGVTAASLTSLQDLIDDYEGSVAKPRNAISNRAAQAETIKTLMKEADDILKEQMDKIAQQYSVSEPEFYTAYKSNRIIIDAPVSNTTLTGTVVNIASNEPLSGVLVKRQDGDESATTDANGEYSLKITIPGIYMFVFTKSGFSPFEEQAELILGQTSTLNAGLNPLA